MSGGARRAEGPARTDGRIRDLADVPSFPAVWAAAVTPRPGRPRSDELPDVAYRVRDVRIDPDRAAAFDHLVGGPATDIVHPGVLHVLAFPVSLALMARPGFPAPLLGVVHVSNRILQHRPVRVGELVDVECRVQNLRPHRRGRTFEAVSTISSGGDIVATDVSTYLARGKGAAEDPSATRPAREEFVPPAVTARWRLGADIGRRFAAVSGDANPIHVSALGARAFGFPSAIAHGMYTASRAFSAARTDLHRPFRWDATFDAPVTIPSTVLVGFTDDVVDGRPRTRGIGWKPARDGKRPRQAFSIEVTTLD